MTIQVSQSVKVSGNSVSSVTTAGLTTVTGDGASASCIQYQSTFTSVTDSKSNTYSQEVAQLQHPSDANAKMNKRYNKNMTGGASHTFTLTCAGSCIPTLHVEIIQGHDPAGTVPDGTPGTLNTTTNESTHTTGDITPSVQPALLLGCGGDTGGVATTFAASNVFTASQNTPMAGGQMGLITGSKRITSGADHFTFTSASSTPAFGMVSAWPEAAAAAVFQRMVGRGFGLAASGGLAG